MHQLQLILSLSVSRIKRRVVQAEINASIRGTWSTRLRVHCTCYQYLAWWHLWSKKTKYQQVNFLHRQIWKCLTGLIVSILESRKRVHFPLFHPYKLCCWQEGVRSREPRDGTENGSLMLATTSPNAVADGPCNLLEKKKTEPKSGTEGKENTSNVCDSRNLKTTVCFDTQRLKPTPTLCCYLLTSWPLLPSTFPS